MTFKEFRTRIDDLYIDLYAEDFTILEFNTRCDKYDDYEVFSFKYGSDRIKVVIGEDE